jgi:hypothetical protein
MSMDLAPVRDKTAYQHEVPHAMLVVLQKSIVVPVHPEVCNKYQKTHGTAGHLDVVQAHLNLLLPSAVSAVSRQKHQTA